MNIPLCHYLIRIINVENYSYYLNYSSLSHIKTIKKNQINKNSIQNVNFIVLKKFLIKQHKKSHMMRNYKIEITNYHYLNNI